MGRTSTSISYRGLLGLMVRLARPFTRLGMTVFAPVHVAVFFQGRIKAFVLNKIAFGRWDLIGDHQTVIIEDAHDMIL